MNIIHVSNFPTNLKSLNLHGVPQKLSNGFIRNGHHVLNISDRSLARARGFGYRKFGVGYANKIVKDLCVLHKPDLLLFGHADIISPDTIFEIRRKLPGVRVVQWHVDAIFHEETVRKIKKKCDVVDATLVSTAGEALRPLFNPKKLLGFLPNPVDSSIETARNYEKDIFPYDLFYACGNPADERLIFGKKRNMNDFLENLISLCPKRKILLPGALGSPHLFGRAYQTALESSAVGLNISRRPDYFLYSSDRIAHLIGNGLVVCMENGSGYESLFSKKEIIFVSSMNELVDQINELSSNGRYRREIAAAGYARYYALFNEKIVAKYIEEVAFGKLKEGAYEWPTLLK